MAPGGLDVTPGAREAIEACTRILQHWKRGRAWSSLQSYMENSVFLLASSAVPASPGDQYVRSPALQAASLTLGSVSCNYNAHGVVRDDDSPFEPEEEPYQWGEPFSILPGGAPLVFHHGKVVNGEVELRCILFFNMTPEGRLFVSGELSIYEGSGGGRDLEGAETFGPLAVEPDTSADVLTTKLYTKDGGWATFALGVATNEGD